jgi:hypothetical protein
VTLSNKHTINKMRSEHKDIQHSGKVNGIMLNIPNNAFMLSVVMLNVVMLSVVAPLQAPVLLNVSRP